MRLSTTSLLAVLASALPAQTLTFAEGSPGALQIVSVAETSPNGPATVVLQNVELLPIELAARTLARELDPTISRRVIRNGIARAELPGGGRLLRYRRAGGQFWGFLWIAADGSAQVALEAQGTGATALADPFGDRIGVAADGRHAVVPSAALAGCHVLRLDGGVFQSTGRIDRFVTASDDVFPTSVMVGAAHVFFQTGDMHLWRCPLADNGTPVDVSPPAVPNGEWKDQMAMSRDGSRLVFLYGPRDQQRLWSIDTTGPATMLPPPPSKYEEPGYLPEDPGEPAMLLDDTGTRLLFVDSIVRDELYLLDVTGALPTLQITQDSIFQPYIGVHILPFFSDPTNGSKLVLAIGDAGLMDWFRVELNAAGGSVTNLTGTGSVQQPFPAGQLDPVQAATASGTLLIAEQTGAAMALRRLDPLGGASAVVQQNLLAAPVAGSAVAGPADIVVSSTGGDRLYRGDTANLFATTPAGVSLTPPVHGTLIAATWVHLAAGLGVIAYYLPDGTIVAGNLELGVEQVCATAAGGFVVVGPQLRYLAPGTVATLSRPAVAQRLCLSGAGG